MVRSEHPAPLGDQFLHDLATDVGQPEIETTKLLRQLQVVETEQPQQCGVKVVDVDGTFRGRPPQVVRLAHHLPTPHATTGHPQAVGVGMVIAARLLAVPSWVSASGVRPNSPLKTTRVESSSPRCFRSFSNAPMG